LKKKENTGSQMGHTKKIIKKNIYSLIYVCQDKDYMYIFEALLCQGKLQSKNA